MPGAGWWVAGFVYLAGILGSVGLGQPSLWIDEAHSVEFSGLHSAFLVVLNAAVRDAYPPLYFLVLHWWRALGSGEAWLRALSLSFHLASIPLAYLAGRRLVSARAGVLAAALLAVSPFHLAFAREIRMYSMVEFLSLASVWGMLRWTSDRSRRGWWVMAFAGVALIYTHFMGALLLLCEGAWLWGMRRERFIWRGTVRWAAFTAVLFLPWLPLFLKAGMVTGGYGAVAPFLQLGWYFLGVLGAGFGQAWWVLAVAVAAMLALGWAGFESLAPGPARRFLAWWALLPAALELGFGLLGKPVFGERTLICSTPAWLILCAAALDALPGFRAAAGAAVMGLLAGLGFAHTIAYIIPTAPSSRDAMQVVAEKSRTGDAILHSSTITYHPVQEYYGRRSGAGLQSYMIASSGRFRGGRMGNWIREQWRRVRDRVDPHEAIESGRDRNRMEEEQFARRGFDRVWYFRTTREGLRRLWLLVPYNFYAPAPGLLEEHPFTDNARVARSYEKLREWRFPGLKLELWERR
jgi:hypothetical protein